MFTGGDEQAYVESLLAGLDAYPAIANAHLVDLGGVRHRAAHHEQSV